MNAIIMFVGLFSFLSDETLLMPPPTAEIKALIAELGHPQYKVREIADLKLRKLGYKALKGVSTASKESLDPEINVRATRIYDSYFAIGSDDKECYMPGIWHMNEKLRFPNGVTLEKATQMMMGSCCKIITEKDVARIYYEKAMRKLDLFDSNGVGSTGWTDEHVAREATKIYIREKLLVGVKPAEIKKLLNAWAENNKEYCHYYQTETLDFPTWDWNQNPPGPMIRRKDFEEPMYGP